jgi:alkanesulfonate monooxygenase SsuD/methylene tetrahydromethanopterin reductase-like flavin-dependent oxidoreductase (luciferase family)
VFVAVEGRFLQADDVTGLGAEAARAEAEGAGALFVSEGPLGDPFVLAAALSQTVRDALLGVRIRLSPTSRHPALVAREMTTLDHVSGGRSVLCFGPPFGDDTVEAIALCRAMWQDGTATSDGPGYPVSGAVNLPLPTSPGRPLVALDLTDDAIVPPSWAGVADLRLVPAAAAGVCRVERP